jgi:hypothetical protein
MSKEKEAFFKNLSPVERISALRENAVEAYHKNVIRDFSDDDLIEMKDRLSEVSIELDNTEIEKKELNKEIKARITDIKCRRGDLLKNIRNKYYESNEQVFDIDDQENGNMLTFDKDGNLIGSRRLTPKEKQTSIKNLNVNTGT